MRQPRNRFLLQRSTSAAPFISCLLFCCVFASCKDESSSSGGTHDGGREGNGAEMSQDDTPDDGRPDFGNGFDRDDDDDDDTGEILPPADLPPPQAIDDAERAQCGDLSCRDALVGDIVLRPCCAGTDEDRCGLLLGPLTAFMPVLGGCAELEQRGALDDTCPSIFFDDAVNPQQLAGCCMPSGRCGVMADLSDLVANFGCVDPDAFLAGRAPATPPAQDQSRPETGNYDAGNQQIHLLDGGGYFVVDGGGVPQMNDPDEVFGDALQSCTPPPEPDPVDAGSAAQSDGGNPLGSDAGSGLTSDAAANPPALDAATTSPGPADASDTDDLGDSDAGEDAGREPSTATTSSDASMESSDAG